MLILLLSAGLGVAGTALGDDVGGQLAPPCVNSVSPTVYVRVCFHDPDPLSAIPVVGLASTTHSARAEVWTYRIPVNDGKDDLLAALVPCVVIYDDNNVRDPCAGLGGERFSQGPTAGPFYATTPDHIDIMGYIVKVKLDAYATALGIGGGLIDQDAYLFCKDQWCNRLT